MLPLGASAVLLGFGFVIAFDDPPVDWRGSWWLIPIVQALVATPFVVRVLAPSLRAVDDRLRDAAAVLGASPARVRREVDLPLLARALAVAAGLAFAVALGEFGATLFVARADLPTLPVAIFRFLGRPGAVNAGQAAALSVVLMTLTLVAVLAAEARGAPTMILAEGIQVAFDGTAVLVDATLAVERGQTLALLGPSGSGKSTLLRVIAGLQVPQTGRVLLDGRDVTDLPAHRRGIGMMFQEPTLFPHRDVGRNVAFGLRIADVPSRVADQRVAELLDLVGLQGFERRAVGGLSGERPSASRSRARLLPSRGRCCWTSRCRPSTALCENGCGTIWRACSASWTSASCT